MDKKINVTLGLTTELDKKGLKDLESGLNSVVSAFGAKVNSIRTAGQRATSNTPNAANKFQPLDFNPFYAGSSSGQFQKKDVQDYILHTEQMRGVTTGVRHEIGRLRNSLLLATFALGGVVREFKASFEETVKAENAMKSLKSVAAATGLSFERLRNTSVDLEQRGIMSISGSAAALKNLAASRLSLGQTVSVFDALTDAAAFNRQGQLTWEEAVKGATEGIKNQNSILIDNAGITKNVSVMFKEYATTIGKTAGSLSELEKRQAIVSGILSEAGIFAGDADRAMSSYQGRISKTQVAILGLRRTLGAMVGESLIELGNKFTDVASGVMKLDLFKDSINNITSSIKIMSDTVGAFISRIAGISSWFSPLMSLVKIYGLLGGASFIGGKISQLGSSFRSGIAEKQFLSNRNILLKDMEVREGGYGYNKFPQSIKAFRSLISSRREIGIQENLAALERQEKETPGITSTRLKEYLNTRLQSNSFSQAMKDVQRIDLEESRNLQIKEMEREKRANAREINKSIKATKFDYAQKRQALWNRPVVDWNQALQAEEALVQEEKTKLEALKGQKKTHSENLKNFKIQTAEQLDAIKNLPTNYSKLQSSIIQRQAAIAGFHTIRDKSSGALSIKESGYEPIKDREEVARHAQTSETVRAQAGMWTKLKIDAESFRLKGGLAMDQVRLGLQQIRHEGVKTAEGFRNLGAGISQMGNMAKSVFGSVVSGLTSLLNYYFLFLTVYSIIDNWLEKGKQKQIDLAEAASNYNIELRSSVALGQTLSHLENQLSNSNRVQAIQSSYSDKGESGIVLLAGLERKRSELTQVVETYNSVIKEFEKGNVDKKAVDYAYKMIQETRTDINSLLTDINLLSQKYTDVFDKNIEGLDKFASKSNSVVAAIHTWGEAQQEFAQQNLLNKSLNSYEVNLEQLSKSTKETLGINAQNSKMFRINELVLEKNFLLEKEKITIESAKKLSSIQTQIEQERVSRIKSSQVATLSKLLSDARNQEKDLKLQIAEANLDLKSFKLSSAQYDLELKLQSAEQEKSISTAKADARNYISDLQNRKISFSLPTMVGTSEAGRTERKTLFSDLEELGKSFNLFYQNQIAPLNFNNLFGDESKLVEKSNKFKTTISEFQYLVTTLSTLKTKFLSLGGNITEESRNEFTKLFSTLSDKTKDSQILIDKLGSSLDLVAKGSDVKTVIAQTKTKTESLSKDQEKLISDRINALKELESQAKLTNLFKFNQQLEDFTNSDKELIIHNSLLESLTKHQFSLTESSIALSEAQREGLNRQKEYTKVEEAALAQAKLAGASMEEQTKLRSNLNKSLDKEKQLTTWAQQEVMINHIRKILPDLDRLNTKTDLFSTGMAAGLEESRLTEYVDSMMSLTIATHDYNNAVKLQIPEAGRIMENWYKNTVLEGIPKLQEYKKTLDDMTRTQTVFAQTQEMAGWGALGIPTDTIGIMAEAAHKVEDLKNQQLELNTKINATATGPVTPGWIESLISLENQYDAVGKLIVATNKQTIDDLTKSWTAFFAQLGNQAFEMGQTLGNALFGEIPGAQRNRDAQEKEQLLSFRKGEINASVYGENIRRINANYADQVNHIWGKTAASVGSSAIKMVSQVIQAMATAEAAKRAAGATDIFGALGAGLGGFVLPGLGLALAAGFIASAIDNSQQEPIPMPMLDSAQSQGMQKFGGTIKAEDVQLTISPTLIINGQQVFIGSGSIVEFVDEATNMFKQSIQLAIDNREINIDSLSGIS